MTKSKIVSPETLKEYIEKNKEEDIFSINEYIEKIS